MWPFTQTPAPKPKPLSDAQVAEAVIQTIQANIGNDDLLYALRDGLIQGLDGMNQLIDAYGGKVVRRLNARGLVVQKAAPGRKGKKR